MLERSPEGSAARRSRLKELDACLAQLNDARAPLPGGGEGSVRATSWYRDALAVGLGEAQLAASLEQEVGDPGGELEELRLQLTKLRDARYTPRQRAVCTPLRLMMAESSTNRLAAAPEESTPEPEPEPEPELAAEDATEIEHSNRFRENESSEDDRTCNEARQEPNKDSRKDARTVEESIEPELELEKLLAQDDELELPPQSPSSQLLELLYADTLGSYSPQSPASLLCSLS